MAPTPEGEEFLAYARQIVSQYRLTEERFILKRQVKKQFSVSTQHYTFAVKAFIQLARQFRPDEYAFGIYECRTAEILENVRSCKSEVGVLYLDDFNREVLEKLLADLQTLRVEYPDDGWTRTPEGDAALDARRVAAGFSAARYNHVLPESGMLTEQDALALARQVLESDGGLSADVLNDPESEMYAVCTQEDGKTVWTVWHHNAVGICAVAIDAADGTILDMIIDTGMAGNG